MGKYIKAWKARVRGQNNAAKELENKHEVLCCEGVSYCDFFHLDAPAADLKLAARQSAKRTY